MPLKRASPKAKFDHVFGQARRVAKMFRPDLYGRIAEAVEIMPASKPIRGSATSLVAYLEMTCDHR
jgi:hypothetical protein